MTANQSFNPGFRLSVFDCMIVLLGAVGTGWAYQIEPAFGLVIAFTVGHFFLFCNVVRMARPRELAWALVFIALISASILTGIPSWNQTFLASLATTCAVVALEMRSPSYHGILWQRINPNLKAWWQMHGRSLS